MRPRTVRAGDLTLRIDSIRWEEYESPGQEHPRTVTLTGKVTPAPESLFIGDSVLVRGTPPVPAPRGGGLPSLVSQASWNVYVRAPVTAEDFRGETPALALEFPLTDRLRPTRVRLRPEVGAASEWHVTGSGPAAVRWRARIVRQLPANRQLSGVAPFLDLQLEEIGPQIWKDGAEFAPVFLLRAPWMPVSTPPKWSQNPPHHRSYQYTLSRQNAGNGSLEPVEFLFYPSLAPVPGLKTVRVDISPEPGGRRVAPVRTPPTGPMTGEQRE